jgi:ElaA protein
LTAALIRSAPTVELDVATLYSILRLRSEVFVVEQDCAYLDPDGRDLEPTTVQVWIESDGRVVATLRAMDEGDGSIRLGRVAVAASERGNGHADALMDHAIALAGTRPIVLDAQSHLAAWYERLGFTITGLDYIEDGISHTPMRRP